MTSKPQISIGAILAGRWQIQDFIGSGETGEVYGVRDLHGNATFALKLFWPSALGQAELWSDVQQAARAAAGLGAEGVARAYDFGIDANAARPFYVTERISWSALDERVRTQGPLTPAEISVAFGVMARALDAAHAAGIVHRDLKPANVFVSPENARWVRITDFGVMRLRSASPPPPGWGAPIGWAAPEAADPNAASIPATDIFALGLVTFFAMTGGALHRAARTTPIDADALRRELIEPLDSASSRARELGASVDPAFDAWFQRAVAPLAQARFGSVAEMASAFDAIVLSLAPPHAPDEDLIPAPTAAVAAASAEAPAIEAEPQAHAVARSQPPEVSALAPAVASRRAAALAMGQPLDARKTGPLPWLIGGGALCIALLAWGVGAYYFQHRPSDEAGSAAANASAAASASAAAVTTSMPTAPAFAPPAGSLSAPAATAAEPPSTEASADEPGPAVPVTPAPAPKATATKPRAPAAKPAPPAAAKPAPPAAAPVKAAAASVKPAVPTAKPVVPSPKPVVPSAKPAPASAKPAASLPAKATTKPALLTPPKKKCGSTFIPCK